MTIEVYESESENSVTVILKHEINKNLLPEDSKLIREVEGNDLEDCMSKHYELMGWGPYIPFTA